MTPQRQFEVRSASNQLIQVLVFDVVDYQIAHTAMRDFVMTRGPEDADQIWLLQHPAVYTQGTACSQVTLNPTGIPVVKTDRGGQITYHGPGQVVMYPLLHLRRYQLGVKALVNTLEQSVIETLLSHNLTGLRRDDAPGVYVDDAKIAALGLRISRGNSYHGLSLNVDMDLAPFSNIDPCGYQGLEVAQLRELLVNTPSLDEVGEQLLRNFIALI